MKVFILILFIISSFFSISQIQNSKRYQADIFFKQTDYKLAIREYEDYGLEKLDSRALADYIVASYISDNYNKIERAIKLWVNLGASPLYISNILQYRIKNIEHELKDFTMFFNKNLSEFNRIYAELIANNYYEFYYSSQYLCHDQHLRFVAIDTQKKVDSKTFLRVDSLNMVRIKTFLENNKMMITKFAEDMLFGVIHHYCGENFFSEEDFSFFEKKILDLVHRGVIDVYLYCYYIDKYNVFHGKSQVYGTYIEFEGLVGITEKQFEEINRNRNHIGLMLKIEDQLKFNL